MLNVTVLIVVVTTVIFSGCSALPQKATDPSSTPSPTAAQSADHASHGTMVASERDFIINMIPHHQEAVDTSKDINASTSDAKLKEFTSAVINTQTAEIETMKQWLKAWYGEEYNVNTTYQPMMRDMKTMQGDQKDKTYIEGMIVHHQGAIEMAELVLKLNPRPEVQAMANDIIKVQASEVQTLQHWLVDSDQS